MKLFSQVLLLVLLAMISCLPKESLLEYSNVEIIDKVLNDSRIQEHLQPSVPLLRFSRPENYFDDNLQNIGNVKIMRAEMAFSQCLGGINIQDIRRSDDMIKMKFRIVHSLCGADENESHMIDIVAKLDHDLNVVEIQKDYSSYIRKHKK